jgi:hypothetical protein
LRGVDKPLELRNVTLEVEPGFVVVDHHDEKGSYTWFPAADIERIETFTKRDP